MIATTNTRYISERIKMKNIHLKLDDTLYSEIDAALQILPRKEYPTTSELIRKLIRIGLDNVNKSKEDIKQSITLA